MNLLMILILLVTANTAPVSEYLGHHLAHPNFMGRDQSELMSVVTADVTCCHHFPLNCFSVHTFCPWFFFLNGATNLCSLPMTNYSTKLTGKRVFL